MGRSLRIAKLYLGLGEDEDFAALDGNRGPSDEVDTRRRRPEPTGWRRTVDGAAVFVAVATALLVLDTWWQQLLAAIVMVIAIHSTAIVLERLFGPSQAAGTMEDA